MMARMVSEPDALALALIASSGAPAVLLARDLTVIAASRSFSHAFLVEPGSMDGRPLVDIGSREWDVPQLRSLLAATLSGSARLDAYEMDLVRPGWDSRRLVLNAQRLDLGDAGPLRLLLTINDVTQARADAKLKDDLLREKAILLQELHHRIANSLQIIASILMISARRVQSEETRTHLYDAHQRVVSIAAVQQQLAATRLGEVTMRPYLTDLCQSIAASMIRDPAQLSLTVEASEGVASADNSVGLGLIVTELVINALKHAFPGQRKGGIVVRYEANGLGWSLAVRDDGVGMPTDAASAKPGLGTSIVEALARQLEARVVIANMAPGTIVTVTHQPSTQAE